MKIALIWPEGVPLGAISFRFEHYLEGFRRLGHEAVMVAPTGTEEGFPHPVETAGDGDLERATFWSGLGVEVAVVLTWHRFSPLLGALQAAGVQVVAISDSDGLVGLRVHPWKVLERMLVYRRGLRPRLGCIKYWLGRYFTDGFTGAREDREFLASTRLSDAIVFGSTQAIHAFRRFLRFHGADEEFRHRLRVVPYAVPESFCTLPLTARRRPRFAALARWSDPQKHAELLAGALRIFLHRHSEAEIELFGRDGEPFFGPLAASFPGVQLRGPQPPPVVQESLASCRSVVFSSRWETGPHAATEALALGATVVGAPIPNLVGITDGGRFGTVAAAHRPRALAEALEQEWQLWERGERDPLAIAAHWRRQVRPESVCRQLLAALKPH